MTEHTGLAAKLKELGEKATPGPWEADSEKDEHGMLFATMSSSAQPFYALFDSMNADYRVVSCEREYDYEGGAIDWDETARRNFALVAELVNNLPAIIAALEARPSPAPDEVERVALQILLAREGLDCDLAMVSDYERHLARAAIAALRPAMPEVPRFFIEHGQIHDRHTGKHVTTDEDSVFCDGINSALALLNRLDADARAAPAPAPTTEGEVEAVARAIYEVDPQRDLRFQHPIHWQDCTTEFQNVYRAKARAAQTAALPSREGEMREALEAIVALASGRRDTGWENYSDGYSAGLIDAATLARAALQPQQKEG